MRTLQTELPVEPVQVPPPRRRHAEGEEQLPSEYTSFVDLDGRCHFYVDTTDPQSVASLPKTPYDIVNFKRLNDITNINEFLIAVHQMLPVGGYYIGCAVTHEHVKQRIYARYPTVVARYLYVLLFLFKRVLPKLSWTRGLCLAITKGRNKMMSKTEVLGRLVYCGFEIIDDESTSHELYFVVRKERDPETAPPPPEGILFRMPRIGKGGEVIRIYKLRTMYPYAQYLQAHLYQRNSLLESGKFNGDFRICRWGVGLRRLWLDELPMAFNWLKGDLKLVGVRPLSAHYLSLYPEPLRKLRLSNQPGLIPPFYVDLPRNFEEILQSEERYLRRYEQAPFRTDAEYLFLALKNILIKGARSS